MQKPSKLQLIILLAVAVLCFGVGAQYGRYLQKNEQAATALLTPLPDATPAPTAPAEQDAPLLAVHIKGAVQRPGVYNLPRGSRVDDALSAAGLLDTANTDIVNLAANLADGMEVVIPFRVDGEETDWQALAQNSASQTTGGEATVNNGSVNINTASLTALQTLSGIGPAKAQAIIDYRTQHGAFQKIEDIKKVSGIGAATFDNIKEHIRVE